MSDAIISPPRITGAPFAVQHPGLNWTPIFACPTAEAADAIALQLDALGAVLAIHNIRLDVIPRGTVRTKIPPAAPNAETIPHAWLTLDQCDELPATLDAASSLVDVLSHLAVSDALTLLSEQTLARYLIRLGQIIKGASSALQTAVSGQVYSREAQ